MESVVVSALEEIEVGIVVEDAGDADHVGAAGSPRRRNGSP